MHFKPSQVVVMVVAGCVALVGAPIGVYAAASSVVIADPTHPSQKAHVDHGKLRVGDGSGALTVNGSVSVKGAVSVKVPTHPWNQINDIVSTSSAPRAVLFQGVGPTKLNLTSLTFSASGPSSGTVSAFLIVYVSDSATGDCVALTGGSFGAAERLQVYVPIGNTVNLTYPTPLQYSAYASTGQEFCVDIEGSGPSSYALHTSASGFTTG